MDTDPCTIPFSYDIVVLGCIIVVVFALQPVVMIFCHYHEPAVCVIRVQQCCKLVDDVL